MICAYIIVHSNIYLLFDLIDALFLPEVLKGVFLQDRRRLAPPEIPADRFVYLFAKELIIFCAKTLFL
jgi:hypothetical protein